MVRTRLHFAAISLLLVAADSWALVLCTTPDGKSYAGDTPPPNCKVKSEYTSSEPPTPQQSLEADLADQKAAQMNAFDAKALSLRRSLERSANDAAEELEETRCKLAAVPVRTAPMAGNVTRRISTRARCSSPR
jgi:hypothetical protein